MASAVSICNLALLRIGVKSFIEDLEDDSTEAEACKAAYELLRDAALAAAPWPFATRRRALGQLAGVTRTGWSYVYTVPDDYLRALFLVPATGRNPRADERTPFELEANDAGDGLVLLTDDSAAELAYTARITAVERYSPQFVDALAWLLASELVLGLAVKPELGPASFKRYQLALSTAAATAANERQQDPAPTPDWIAGRS